MSDTPKLQQAADGSCPPATCSPSLESLKGLKGAEYRKAWNKLHRERCRQSEREWRKRNPDKCKMPEDRKKMLTKIYRESGKRRIARDRHKPIYYGEWEKASMRREPWGVVEDCMVMARKASDRQLAAQLGRSIKAIQMRRCKLKKQNLEENTKDIGA